LRGSSEIFLQVYPRDNSCENTRQDPCKDPQENSLEDSNNFLGIHEKILVRILEKVLVRILENILVRILKNILLRNREVFCGSLKIFM
jgi:hypothetical protein